jgi:Ser/Thr protein kinase RdoA (MazF antagonist)
VTEDTRGSSAGESPDLCELLAAWGIETNVAVQVLTGGTNNLSYFLETSEHRFILRIYENTSDLPRLRYEHALLTQLAGAGLPFAVPAPIPAASGQTLIQVPDGGDVLAALFPFILGRHPHHASGSQLPACGIALGRLDAALAAITTDLSASSLTTFGELAAVHPAVRDPLALPSELSFVEPGQRARCAEIQFGVYPAPCPSGDSTRSSSGLPGSTQTRFGISPKARSADTRASAL